MGVITHKVEWIKDLGDRGKCDSFSLYLPIDGKKTRVRVMNIDYFYQLREKNQVPASVTDVDFLCGDPSFREIMRQLGCTHVELAYDIMADTKSGKGGEKVQFSPDAFEQSGSTQGSIQ